MNKSENNSNQPNTCGVSTASASPTSTQSPTPTSTQSPTPTPTPTSTQSPTPTPTPTTTQSQTAGHNSQFILAIDAGTTSERVALIRRDGGIQRMAQAEIRQTFPHDGWVEEDPQEMWEVAHRLILDVMESEGITAADISAIGMANQRETTIVWNRETGEPIYPAIVWQCRRTAAYCEELKAQGLTSFIRRKTGLVLDAYFSATKLRWILQHVEGAYDLAKAAGLCFGTVDSWLLWKLTDGKVHVTDHSNASRTLLYNLETASWDQELLELFDIPEAILPEIVGHDAFVGETRLFGAPIPLAPALGDQQASLFGQLCFDAGSSKNTYGTGGFLLVNTGNELIFDEQGLVTTVAWQRDGKLTYAMEGSVFIAGAAVKWLRDKVGLIETAGSSAALAESIPDNGGCYLVPAFTGLGAPHWDPYARGLLIGMTQDTSRAHIVRATLESIAYQTEDILEMIREALPGLVTSLRVDGGAAQNDFLLQFQADVSRIVVERSSNPETTVLGAAYLAGLLSGVWKDPEELQKLPQNTTYFRPSLPLEEAERLMGQWHRAVERSQGWLDQ